MDTGREYRGKVLVSLHRPSAGQVYKRNFSHGPSRHDGHFKWQIAESGAAQQKQKADLLLVRVEPALCLSCIGGDWQVRRNKGKQWPAAVLRAAGQEAGRRQVI